MTLPLLILIIFGVAIIGLPLVLVAYSVQNADDERRKIGRCRFVE